MSVAAADQPLYSIVSAAAPSTIEDVLQTMEAIDQVLADSDGLKWFNRLYLITTREVDLHPPSGGWKDPAWLVRLDVIFAGLYFRAIVDFLDNSPSTPGAWVALLESRFRPAVERVQFAVAGMNAHINHDLALALLNTNTATGLVPALDSHQHADFEGVNTLLEDIMPTALNMLAVGLLGVAAEDTGEIGRLLAFWNLCSARDLAWNFADHLRTLDDPARTIALATQDQMTAVLGRAILFNP